MRMALQVIIVGSVAAVAAACHIGAGTELVKAFKNSAARRSCRPEGKDFVQAAAIENRFHFRKAENAFRLRRKDNCIMDFGIKQRFDSKGISEQSESPVPLIVDGKGKDAVHVSHKISAKSKKREQEELGVGMCCGSDAALLQIFPECAGIVYLTVVDDMVAVGIKVPGHGLAAAGQIDDRKAGMCQSTIVE